MVLSKEFAEFSGNIQEILHSGKSPSRCPVLIAEDGPDILSRNIHNKIPADAAQNTIKVMTSVKDDFLYYSENKLRL
jgi:hypothetical protein